MAASLVQSAVFHSNGVNTVYTASFPVLPTPGNLIVVMCGGQLGAPGATTAVITDNQGNPTYTNLKLQSAAQCLAVIAACPNVAAAGTFTITVTYDQLQVHNNFVLQEWTGVPATLTLDGTSQGSGNNNGATQAAGTLTTTNADDILLAFVINNGNSPLTETAPAGYTLDQTYLFQVGCASAYNVVSGTVSAAVAFGTTDNTGQWNAITVAIIWQGGAALPEARLTALQAEYTSLPASGSSAARLSSLQIETIWDTDTAARLSALQVEWFSGLPIPPPPIVPSPGIPIVPGGGPGGGPGGSGPILGVRPVVLPDPRICCGWLGEQTKCVFYPTGERYQLLRYKAAIYDSRR
jgi:hypothetical protein